MRASMPRLTNLMRVRTNDGVVDADPSADPLGYGKLLEASSDHRVTQGRQREDATPLPAGLDPAQSEYFKTFNRSQEDGAMGPAGYNRPWAGFLEAPQVVGENAGMSSRIDARSMSALRSRTHPGADDGPYGAFGSGPATEGPYGSFGSGPATEGPYGRIVGNSTPLPESHESFVARTRRRIFGGQA